MKVIILLKGLRGGFPGVSGKGFSIYMLMIESTGDNSPCSSEDSKAVFEPAWEEDETSCFSEGPELEHEGMISKKGKGMSALEQYKKCKVRCRPKPSDKAISHDVSDLDKHYGQMTDRISQQRKFMRHEVPNSSP